MTDTLNDCKWHGKNWHAGCPACERVEVSNPVNRTLIQCIAESRDALSGILPYIDGSGFSTIYAIKQAKEQIERCQQAIDAHEAQQCKILDNDDIEALLIAYDHAKEHGLSVTAIQSNIDIVREMMTTTPKRESGEGEAVERAAKALSQWREDVEYKKPQWPKLGEPVREAYRKQARAAIDAMKVTGK